MIHCRIIFKLALNIKFTMKEGSWFNEDGSLRLPNQIRKMKKFKEQDPGRLNFLKDEIYEKPEREFWNLYINNKEAEPLEFSNKKTQEDVVKEIIGLINGGTKVIFLKGACGTGKSAIALKYRSADW